MHILYNILINSVYIFWKINTYIIVANITIIVFEYRELF